MPDLAGAIQRGMVCHCPICDGHEVTDQAIAVVGRSGKLAREALFVRRYTSRLTAFSVGDPALLDDRSRALLSDAGITLSERGIRRVHTGRGMVVGLETDDASVYRFDTLYSAPGARSRVPSWRSSSARAAAAMARTCTLRSPASMRQATWCPASNQISVAIGQAALAATAIDHR